MKLVVYFLLITNLMFSQSVLDLEYKQLSFQSDSLTISEIVTLEKQGRFSTLFTNKIYQDFKNKEAIWITAEIPKLKEDYFISIENPLLDILEIYLYRNNQIKRLELQTGEYRFPQAHISKETSPSKLFIRTKDATSYRTEFLIKILNIKEFKKKMQADYFIIGAYVIGIIVLLTCACILFLYKRQYVILWYMVHLCALVSEYLADNGILGQWLVSNQTIYKYNLDNIFIMISVMSLSEFFRNYYNYNHKTLFCKSIIYKGISLFCACGVLLSLVTLFFVEIINIEYYAHIALNYCSLASLIAHCILARYRVIPMYMFVAFLLPIVGVYANLGNFKELFNDPYVIYFIYQSVYLGIFINVFVIIFYISKQSIDGEFLSINLKKENNFLKNNFHENLSVLQEEHQNILMSDVHDSFGGYIEALRLNLLNKKLNDKKINEILNAFKKDYRFLLNSLYIPNINSDNFEQAIEEYCDKMNKLSNITIVFNSAINKHVELPQQIAKLIFKATSELTTNAIKYSKGSVINIDLILRRQNIYLAVTDDGIGFKTKNIPSTSFGINGIKERVQLLCGNFNVKVKNGTSILIHIPLLKE
ncbi:sensor histidine kinase [Ochrovirga pacifica]|uniref:sensor histidine kinase n=1 Tax=Ochrovirga pacifica TaxID=1042376 RepID=UPI000255A812|nr:ATP-binding protein [Ochrovirga pacifica]